MPFINPNRLPKSELFPSVMSRLVSGDNVMLSFVEMPDGADLPEHAHPEEQAGLMLEGKLLLRIGEEEHTLAPGEAYIVPANMKHSAKVVEGPMRCLDIFGPPREDYRRLIAESRAEYER